MLRDFFEGADIARIRANAISIKGDKQYKTTEIYINFQSGFYFVSKKTPDEVNSLLEERKWIEATLVLDESYEGISYMAGELRQIDDKWLVFKPA